jgi:hypothetical protein
MLLPGLLVVAVLQQTPTAPANPPLITQPPASGTEPSVPDPKGFDSLVQEDVEPTLPVLQTENIDLRVGGLLQLHASPYAGPDAQIANGDPASQAGFRVRRARVGFEGWFRDRLGLLLSLNALESDKEAGVLSDAKLMFDFRRWLRFTVGTGKVPLSRAGLESSRTLSSIERPLAVNLLSPSKRLGLTVEGDLLSSGRLSYLAALMNGTEGFQLGNQYGGFLTGARVVLTPWGNPQRGEWTATGLAVGVGGIYENGPGARSSAFSADVLLAFAGASLEVAGLCDRKTPQIAPVGPSPTDGLSRCGAYVETGYAFQVLSRALQISARVEWMDDNQSVSDAGDSLLYSGGINASIVDSYVRAQLHYVGRRERFTAQRQNDVLVLALQGAF